MIKSLKERGLRIDAIGMQGHIGMDYPSIEEYQAAINDYVSAGVKVMVTELDLSALPSVRHNVGANVSDVETYRKEVNPYIEGLPAKISKEWMLACRISLICFYKTVIKFYALLFGELQMVIHGK